MTAIMYGSCRVKVDDIVFRLPRVFLSLFPWCLCAVPKHGGFKGLVGMEQVTAGKRLVG